MTMACGSGQITLGWPADHTGWLLQAQTNGPGCGLGTNWVTIGSSDTNNHFTVSVVVTNGSAFFKLAHP